MLDEREMVAKVKRLTVTRLRVWVREGWIKPVDEKARGFSEADLARAALIRDLLDELGFGEDEVPVVLSLIDQIHGLRNELRCLVEAIDAAPEDARAEIKRRIIARRRTLTPR
jgi:chaperone modulatory protein CbpM